MLSSNGLSTPSLIQFFNDRCKEQNIRSICVVSLQESYEDKKRTDYQVNKLMQMGYKVRHFNLSEETSPNLMEEGQMLYVCGGNTYRILNYIKEKKMFDYFMGRINRGDFYFGISAGSMLCCPDIKISSYGTKEGGMNDKNVVGLENFKGFGVIPFYIYPHYSDTESKEVKRFYDDTKSPVIAINDSQMITVDSEGINVVGDETGVYGLGIEIG